jgi:hypothetical protein
MLATGILTFISSVRSATYIRKSPKPGDLEFKVIFAPFLYHYQTIYFNQYLKV